MQELEPGQVVAERYEVVRYVGRGGMGTVWAVRDRDSGAPRALKLLRRPEPDARLRFLREVEVMRDLTHPSVVKLHDVVELRSGPALVMDLLEGETLRARFDRDLPLGVEECCRLLAPVASALAAAHALGIVHRDVKPENVFLEREPGGVRLLDFGVAKLLVPEATGALRTELGAVLGTLFYMSPEQALGLRDIDERADSWALGVVLYEALSGGRPIEGETPNGVVRRLLTGAIVPLVELRPELPAELLALITRMLIRGREERLRDLGTVKSVLERFAG